MCHDTDFIFMTTNLVWKCKVLIPKQTHFWLRNPSAHKAAWTWLSSLWSHKSQSLSQKLNMAATTSTVPAATQSWSLLLDSRERFGRTWKGVIWSLLSLLLSLFNMPCPKGTCPSNPLLVSSPFSNYSWCCTNDQGFFKYYFSRYSPFFEAKRWNISIKAKIQVPVLNYPFENTSHSSPLIMSSYWSMLNLRMQ